MNKTRLLPPTLFIALAALLALGFLFTTPTGAAAAAEPVVTAAQGQQVLIYGVEGCGHTLAARQHYDNHVFYNVRENPRRMAELESMTGGKRRWPVIVTPQGVKIGFNGT